MKIGIEAQRLFRAKKHGMDIVILEIIKQLELLDTEHVFYIFVRPDVDSSVLSESKNIKIVRVWMPNFILWEQIALPIAAFFKQVKVLHCTSNTAPIITHCKLITTLHDIIYLERNNFSKGTAYQKLGNFYRQLLVPMLIRKSAIISTVSNSEKAIIAARFPKAADKICVNYNGVGNHFLPATATETLQQIRLKYQLPETYLLFFGNTDPKKNLYTVTKAYNLYATQTAAPLPLVIVDYDINSLKRLLQEQNTPELINHIILPGYIPNNELPAIYSLASLFLYPSLRESFGIPVLEAMSCGTAVIAANISAIAEVAADAALLVPPTDADTMANAIIFLLQNKIEKDLLIQKGFERAKQFSWQDTAKRTLETYLSIA